MVQQLSSAKEKGYSLSYIADLTNTKIVGNKDFIVDNLSTLENASNTSITFLANTKYKKYLKNTKSLAIITNQENIQKDNKIILSVKIHMRYTLLLASYLNQQILN